MEQKIFTCPNCGAPAEGDTCEYCGTPFSTAYGNSSNIILKIDGQEVAHCYLGSVEYKILRMIGGRDIHGRKSLPDVATKRVFTLIEI